MLLLFLAAEDGRSLTNPRCKRCIRLERPCSFANEATAFVAVNPGGRPTSSKSTSDAKASPGAITQRIIKDLELMHLYSTSTCFTMTDVEENLPTWQYDMARLAFKHEFLLHGLLALSALHMSSSTYFQDRFLGDLARNHQSLALASYIPQLRDINQENCNALFAFSAILGATSFAFLQHHEVETTSSEFITSVIDVFELLVGSTVIAVEGRTWLKNGNLACLLGPHPFLARETSNCSVEARASLDAVLACAEAVKSPGSSGSNTPEGCMSIYALSADQLARLFPASTNQTVSMEKVIGWPALAGSPLISRLKKGDAIAMIILAHYGAALHISEHIWYLKGLGIRLVRAIVDIVDDEWMPYLSWPLGQVSM